MKQKLKYRNLIKILAALLLCCVSGTKVVAQYTQEQLKTAYIFNFAENIRWPNENDLNDFKIGVLGESDTILKELKEFTVDEQIKKKPIVISSSNNLDDLLNSQIIYLSNKNNKDFSVIFNRVAGKNILVVTDQLENQLLVMINFLKKSDDRVHFELNERNINAQGLSVLPDMVLLGGTNLDVQELYKKSQSKLLSKEEQLEDQQKLLNKLQSNLTRISEEIEKQRDVISKQTAELLSKQNLLDSKNKELKSLLEETDIKSKLLQEQQEIQAEQQAEIIIKKKELEEYTAQLTEKYAEVDALQIKIDEKQSILNKQNITIATQQNLLYVLILIILLVLSLIFLIYKGFRNKKIANLKLEEKNRHIEEQRLELEKSYKHLKELEDFKESMTNMIVHDLKNPLNSIIGLSETTASQEELHTINASGRRMLHLVTNILDINKFEESKFQLKLENSAVKSVIEEAIDEVSVQLTVSSLKVNNDANSGHVANYDFELISRVMMNILTNAIKYTPPGGSITIDSAEENGMIKISISDTGQGIPEDKLESVFDKFSQVKNKMYGKTSSTGLGLTFCKLAVEAHKGKIGVLSKLGEGTTFYFTLPKGNADNLTIKDSTKPKTEDKTKHIKQGYQFSDDDRKIIKGVIPKLLECKVFEYGKISEILDPLEDSSSEPFNKWKNDVLESAVMGNEVRYKELTSDTLLKYSQE